MRRVASQTAALPSLPIAVALFVLAACSGVGYAQNRLVMGVLKPDKACGPRCLSAIMKMTGRDESEYGIGRIYEVIGKEPYAPTNLKELRDAARALGFSAEAYKWKIADLAKARGFIILPVGSGVGSAKHPLHFILVVAVTGDHLRVVDGIALESHDIPVSSLERRWNGYALVITPGKGMGPAVGTFGPPKAASTRAATAFDEIKDFGNVNAGDLVKHTFVLGDSDGIDGRPEVVMKNCKCLEASLGIDENGKILLTMEFSVDDPGQQQVMAAVRLGNNGPVKRYALRAYARDSFVAYPARAHIEAPAAGKVEYDIRIEYYSDPSDVVIFDRLETAITGLSVGASSAAKGKSGAPGVFVFNIALLYDLDAQEAHAAWTNDTLKFVFNTKTGPRVVPIRLSIHNRRFTIANTSSTTQPRSTCLARRSSRPGGIVATRRKSQEVAAGHRRPPFVAACRSRPQFVAVSSTLAKR